MSMQDTVADMLTRIRNAQRASKPSVDMMSSKEKVSILEVMQQEGFIKDFQVADLENNKKTLLVNLKYHNDSPVIELLQRISRPSLRVYVSKDELPVVLGGLGVAVISTSKGLMTDKQARAQGLGGEVICHIA